MVPALRFVVVFMSLLRVCGLRLLGDAEAAGLDVRLGLHCTSPFVCAGVVDPAFISVSGLRRVQQTTMMPAFRFDFVFMVVISFHSHRRGIGPKSIIVIRRL